jgi:hypothetical protein
MEIIPTVRVFDHDREIVLGTEKSKNKRRVIIKHTGTAHDCMYSQHRSHPHHHRVLCHEVVYDAHGNHFICDNRTSICTSRSSCAVHSRITGNEALDERLHELARRVSATPHEVRAAHEGAEEFRPVG